MGTDDRAPDGLSSDHSFRVATGEKYASPDSNLFRRTVFKWVALHTPLPWPHGVATRPEMLQGHGGTPPSDWIRDRAELQDLIRPSPHGKAMASILCSVK